MRKIFKFSYIYLFCFLIFPFFSYSESSNKSLINFEHPEEFEEYSGGNAINQARLQHNQQENSSSSDNRSEAQKHYFKTVPGYVKCLSPPFVVVENVAGVSSRVNSDAATFGDLGVVQQLLQRLQNNFTNNWYTSLAKDTSLTDEEFRQLCMPEEGAPPPYAHTLHVLAPALLYGLPLPQGEQPVLPGPLKEPAAHRSRLLTVHSAASTHMRAVAL